jgi:putative spermidine/putrescine transport system permease protein
MPPPRMVDAAAVIHLLATLVLLLIALRFVDSTQLVTRIREVPAE